MSDWYYRDGTKVPGDNVNEVIDNLGDRFSDFDYKRVAATTLKDGTWISTVWLGLDHSYTDEGPPLIFETMVFPSRDDLDEQDAERYATEAEALDGHARLVEKWEKRIEEEA